MHYYMLTTYEALIVIFASYRLGRLIQHDIILDPIRNLFFTTREFDGENYLVPKGFIGKLIQCHWCVTIWTVAIVYFTLAYVHSVFIFIWTVFAIASIVSFINIGVSKHE